MKRPKYIAEIKRFEEKNDMFLPLTANENQISDTARDFLKSNLSNRYYFGGGSQGFVDWNPFTVLGMKQVETLVNKAEQVLKRMLNATDVNLNCLSGIHAMMCVILSVTKPGETVMSVRHSDGGHFATGNILKVTGRKQVFAKYDLMKQKFDAKKTARIFKKSEAKLLYLDISYYISPVNLIDLRRELGNKPIIVFDASHTLGLIMGGKFQSPLLEGADIVCGNTHKTLPGPQKGLIAYKDPKLAKKSTIILQSGLYSSVHTHQLISLAITILEMEKFGKEYSQQIISNSNSLGKTLEDLGYEIRKSSDGNYSMNHQIHVFIDKLGDRRTLYKRLIKKNISTNFDNPLGGRLFIRIGTQNMTRLGMKESQMRTVAKLLDSALKGNSIRSKVIKLMKDFRKINYSFDS